ncbi:hypothetical protein QCN32_gp82 [Arthrobacter phage Niktson]|uniref:Uncharacterized protein n=1 Tax=Arthrobacter phage Niktson TaxID=2014347 RepID=A0A218M5Q5_9CAUD|nr:hypothetical protein QCN32_gp82 [Arthrobacter phage Niktson]ASD52301.1 hypothetical protein NIKTSON_82 [Arthrobacter phage Niktson]ASD52395.1 hypothetical protein ELEPHANTMAN_82 [Arthrobacter phage ElephantMan]
MSNLLPEAKVTIVIDQLGGRVKKLVVPLASKPEYGLSDTWGVNDENPDSDKHFMFTAEEKHFSFGCYSLYDIDQNLVVQETNLTREQYEDQVIAEARDILRQRWQNPETKTVNTTSIAIVRGDN